MKVSIIGSGYVGLVSGVCLAEKGHQVICVDIDQNKVEQINKGIPPIYEEGLDELLKKNLQRDFSTTTNLHDSVKNTEISIIAVGTSSDSNDIDLRYVREAAIQIGKVLRYKSTYHLVVVKSTVLPGTTDEVITPILEELSEKTVGSEFGICMNPEFLREGKAIQDFMYPDRIIIGGKDEKSIYILEQLYSVFKGVPIFKTNCKTAEMIKYTSNSLLATMISFTSEIASLCEVTEGVDLIDVMKGVHLDKRLTPILPDGTRIVPSFTTYLQAAGCGFGGSCLPKDVKALVAYGNQMKVSMQLLESVISINIAQPLKILKFLRKYYPKLENLNVAVLGLAFKPQTDDIRESPAIAVIKLLLSQGAIIKTYDPVAMNNAKKIFSEDKLIFCSSLKQTIEDVEAIVLMTCWPDFRQIPAMLVQLKKIPLVIDSCRMLDKGISTRYEGIGK